MNFDPVPPYCLTSVPVSGVFPSSPALDPVRLVPLFQSILEDFPVGLAIMETHGTPVWYNAEAVVACAVWNGRPRGADALPLVAETFQLPEVLRWQCRALERSWTDSKVIPAPVDVAEPEHGLYARLGLQSAQGGEPLCYLRLDYRRPRADRVREISPEGLQLLARLTFREREVALRLRDGLTTLEIARNLRRSPLTIKSQLGAIFRKLGVTNRTRVVALLNR